MFLLLVILIFRAELSFQVIMTVFLQNFVNTGFYSKNPWAAAEQFLGDFFDTSFTEMNVK